MEPVVMSQEVAVPTGLKETIKSNEYRGRRLISHSEVDGYNQCEQKHYFAHEEKLQPKKRSDALSKGSAGHLFLETFLQAIKDGIEHTQAIQIALQKTAGEPNAADIIPVCMYWAQNIWPTLGWKIIEVEYEFEPVNVAEGLALPGKIDLIAEVNDEKHGKCIAIIDHKFLYDPYPQPVFDLMPQIPKYIGIMRSKGLPVKMGMYNVLRTRTLKDPNDAYKQIPVYPSNEMIKTHIIEHVDGMKQIHENSQNPDYRPRRTINKMNCGHCGFLDLCTARANGRDTKLLERMDFEPNTYGYKDAE